MSKMAYRDLQASLIKRREKREKWKDIGKDYPGVPLGTLCRIAHDKTYEPKNHLIRHALGLDPLPIEVLPCAKCGQLHAFSRRCPGSFIKYKPHPVMRLSKIRRILQSPYLNNS